MSKIDLVELQDKIGRMCSGLVARVNDHTKRLSRWPEELSQLNQVVAVVNELGRVVTHMKDSAAAGKEVKQHDQTQSILAQAFEDVLGSIDIETLGEPRKEKLPSFVFDGRIFTVAEIVQFLSDNLRSGQVSIKSPRETFILAMNGGQVVSAYSTNSPSGFRLGEILVRKFGIDKYVLAEFMGRGGQGQGPLGQALSNHSIVPEALVFDALHYQMVHLFERCLALNDADIEFDPSIIQTKADGPCLTLADILIKSNDRSSVVI
ncbi:MAG: hypothetical protein ACI97A_002636 [Planctomycetota bacterium]|jgi:hypothetical protein